MSGISKITFGVFLALLICDYAVSETRYLSPLANRLIRQNGGNSSTFSEDIKDRIMQSEESFLREKWSEGTATFVKKYVHLVPVVFPNSSHQMIPVCHAAVRLEKPGRKNETRVASCKAESADVCLSPMECYIKQDFFEHTGESVKVNGKVEDPEGRALSNYFTVGQQAQMETEKRLQKELYTGYTFDYSRQELIGRLNLLEISGSKDGATGKAYMCLAYVRGEKGPSRKGRSITCMSDAPFVCPKAKVCLTRIDHYRLDNKFVKIAGERARNSGTDESITHTDRRPNSTLTSVGYSR